MKRVRFSKKTKKVQEYRESCFVPLCGNTTINAPEKVFLFVPEREEIRKEWCRSAGLAYAEMRKISFCCEDHFDLDEDLEKGSTQMLKDGVVPRFFPRQTPNKTLSEYPQIEESILQEKQTESQLDMPRNTRSKIWCAAKFCKNNTKKNPALKFFCFPDNPQISDQWNANCSRHSSSVVCSVHFTPEMFTDASRSKLHGFAIPSIFQNTRYEQLEEHAFQTIFQNTVNESWPVADNDDPKLIAYSINKGVRMKGSSSQTTLSYNKRINFGVRYLQDQDIRSFIGLSTTDFNKFYFLLFNYMKTDNLNLSIEDQLFLTLGKYRHNLSFEMLGSLFQISPVQANTNFEKCTSAISEKISEMRFESCQFALRTANKIAIDFIEIPVEESPNDSYNKLMHSKEKLAPTFKALICVDNRGDIVFVSDLYSGCTSDEQIIIKSNFLDLIPAGKMIFSNKPLQIPNIQERKILIIYASISHHVPIGKLNLQTYFKLLRDPMIREFWPIANKIFKNCVMLANCNLQNVTVPTVLF